MTFCYSFNLYEKKNCRGCVNISKFVYITWISGVCTFWVLINVSLQATYIEIISLKSTTLFIDQISGQNRSEHI